MGSMARWLDVEVGTGDVELNTLPSNVALIDLNNDNEYKLLIGDLGKGMSGQELKICKGAMQISDLSLPDLPLGVVGLYTSEAVPRSPPIIAVAFSSCIYFYRNLKLFYKYYLPTIDLNPSEMEVWKQLLDPVNQNPESIESITANLKATPSKLLTPQSRHFLHLTPDEQLEYLEQAPELPAKAPVEIACVAALRISSVDRYAVSCLVVGTEDGEIVILEPQMFTALSQAKLCPVKKTPYQIVATGLYNVDYRLTVATREKTVCLLKRDWSEGRILFTTDEHIIAIEVMTTDNSVMVICADNTMACYSKKGKKQWSITLEHRPVSMTLVPVLRLGTTLTAVALASGHVQLYDAKAQRDALFVRGLLFRFRTREWYAHEGFPFMRESDSHLAGFFSDVASVMKFGQLGQEEHVFIIVTGSGNLMLKILKRTADFNAHAAGVDVAPSLPSGHKPWLIPKKSKLFLEQSVRERENATAMHEVFLFELNRLRVAAAKTLLEAHVKSDNSVGAGPMESMRLTAEVEGLGPVFRVTLVVENTSAVTAVVGLAILFHVHTINYKVSNPYIKVPLLSPGSKLKFPTKIEEVFDDNINPDVFFRPVTGQAGDRSLVKILLIKDGRKSPVLAATVQMPPTDPMMLPFDKIQDGGGWD